ncbi:hypothetical protein E3U55_17005 [Filobacillus milosensis]|uniref:Lipoprotein n=1 Tax=Filobacillus milosensis TaxID=94137 RepID=A0A4Y8ID02_9BACI|nr:hypothetical protein [Filobacillus milosensis]TFB12813.1 hypothetical protein E3U55_17005 [Filobacillus milosensis]
MKKILLFLIIGLVLIGCTKDDAETHNISKVGEGEVTSYKDVLLVSDINEDLNGDGNKERIVLRVSPAPFVTSENPKQYGWDDSHIWQLFVEDHEGNTYSLFDDSVQFSAQMYIVGKENKEKAIVFEINGTSLKLIEYRYNSDGYFEKRNIYKNSPMIHKSSI